MCTLRQFSYISFNYGLDKLKQKVVFTPKIVLLLVGISVFGLMVGLSIGFILSLLIMQMEQKGQDYLIILKRKDTESKTIKKYR